MYRELYYKTPLLSPAHPHATPEGKHACAQGVAYMYSKRSDVAFAKEVAGWTLVSY